MKTLNFFAFCANFDLNRFSCHMEEFFLVAILGENDMSQQTLPLFSVIQTSANWQKTTANLHKMSAANSGLNF